MCIRDRFWAAVGRQIPQLVLLDIMLPQEDGLSVLQKLRSRSDTRRLPVIMLTARSSEFDKVTGLDSGADDYIAKPFGMMEPVSYTHLDVYKRQMLHRFNTALVSDVTHQP